MAYSAPTASTLKTRYPAFAGVLDATVEVWLTDARLIVTDSWIENDRAIAEMLLAAHNMIKVGVAGLTSGLVGTMAGMGVTSFKSGSFDVSFNSDAAKVRAGSGYASTDYGAQFMVYLRRNRGGPYIASGAVAESC